MPASSLVAQSCPSIQSLHTRPSCTVRIRPAEPCQRGGSSYLPSSCWRTQGAHKLSTTCSQRGISVRQNEQCYTADSVFEGHGRNEEVYASLVQPLVHASMQCINGVVFAYGQTSSGKTHTMFGASTGAGQHTQATDADALGLVDYTIQDLLRRQPASLLLSTCQIHLDTVTNLLQSDGPSTPGPRTPLMKSRSFRTPRSEMHTITSYQQASCLLQQAQQQRALASTRLNAMSSRSHMVVQLVSAMLKAHAATPGDHASRWTDVEPVAGCGRACIMLVDLAGSEDPRKSGAQGKQLQEAISINMSLLTLQNVIMAWATNPLGHIPYEDSMLTRKLKPCLSSEARVAMLITIRSEEMYQAESIRALDFAKTAMRITCTPKSNKTETPDRRMEQQLRLRMQALEADCEELRREKASLTLSVAKTCSDADHMRLRCHEALRDLRAAQEEALTRDAHIAALQAQLQEKEQRIELLQGQLEHETGVTEALHGQLASTHTQLHETRELAQDQQERLDGYASQVTTLKMELSAARNQTTSQQSALQQELQHLTEQLEMQTKAHSAELRQLQQEQEQQRKVELSQWQEQLHERLAKQEQQFKEQQRQSQLDRVQQAMEQVSKHSAERQQWQQAMQQGDAKAAELQAQVAELQSHVADLEATVESQSQHHTLEVVQLSQQAEHGARAAEQVRQLQQQLKDLSEAAHDVRQNAALSATALQASQEECEQLRKQLEGGSLNAAQVQKQLSGAQLDNECLKAQLWSLQEQLSAHAQLRDDLQQELYSTVLLAVEARSMYNRVQAVASSMADSISPHADNRGPATWTVVSSPRKLASKWPSSPNRAPRERSPGLAPGLVQQFSNRPPCNNHGSA